MEIVALAFHRQINSFFYPFNPASTFSKLLILGIAMLFFAPDSAQAQVEYKVTMKTGNNGADNTVWIRLFGTNSNPRLKVGNEIQWDQIDYYVCDNDGDDRQAGKTDKYTFSVGDGNVVDVGVVTNIQIAGDAGRDWKLDELTVERIVPEQFEKSYPNIPFKSTFTTFRNLIYRDWVTREIDNINKVTPELITEAGGTGTVVMYDYSGFIEAAQRNAGAAPVTKTIKTTATASKGASISTSSSKETRNAWAFGVSTSFGSNILGTEFSTDISFDSNSSVTNTETETRTTDNSDSFTMETTTTRTFDAGFTHYVIFETTLSLEEHKAKVLGEPFDILKPISNGMIVSTYPFRFAPGEPIPRELEDIKLKKLKGEAARNWLMNYAVNSTYYVSDTDTQPADQMESSIIPTSSSSNNTDASTERLDGGSGGDILLNSSSNDTYACIEMNDGLHNKALIGGDTYNGSIYHQDAKSRDNAKWQFKPTGDGYYNIIDSRHNKALVAGDNANNRVYHQDANGRDNAKWKLEPVGDGTFHITDKKHGKSLIAGTTYDGNVYHQKPKGRKNATWKLTVVSSGNGTIPTELR